MRPSVFAELDALDVTGLVERFHREPPKEERQTRSSYYLEIAMRIGGSGHPGLDYLWTTLETADVERKYAVLVALSMCEVRTSDRARLEAILVETVSHPNTLLSVAAIDGLWRLGIDSDAVRQMIIARESDPNPYVRSAVLRFASHGSNPDLKAMVSKGVNDPDEVVRFSSIDAIDDLQMIDLLPALRELSKNDPSDGVREAAAMVAANLAEERDARHAATLLALDPGNTERVAFISRLLEEGRAIQVAEVIDKLVAQRDGAYWVRVRDMCLDPSPYVRRSAIHYSAELSPLAAATAAVVLGLRDSDPMVRLAALDGVRSVGSEQFADELSELENDRDERVRSAVASLLKDLRP